MERSFVEQSYFFMLSDISSCGRDKHDIKEQLECSFLTCNRHWTQLRKDILAAGFASQSEEIEFFRKWKPLFISEMEFQSLRYHAQLVIDHEADPVAVSNFHKREALRLDKYRKDNLEFYEYYTSGKHHYDERWFVRKSAAELDSTHDRYVSTLLALERYTKFINEINVGLLLGQLSGKKP